MLKTGDLLPSFVIPDQDDQPFNSQQLIGKSAVIFFYPKDDTPVCTAEACSFRNEYDQFNELETEVIGISADSPDSHKKFIQKHNLNYSLLSDEDQKVRKLFKLEKSLFGLLPPRVTFVFNAKGQLIKTIDSRWNGKAHMKEALKVLKQ